MKFAGTFGVTMKDQINYMNNISKSNIEACKTAKTLAVVYRCPTVEPKAFIK